MLQNAMVGSWEMMGLESSKHSTPMDVSCPAWQADLQSRFDNPENPSTTIHQSNGSHKISIPLKRSRNERDRGNDMSSSPTKEHSAKVPTSPLNLRESFIPDRTDHWSPKRNHRLDGGSRSPGSTRRRDRGDRWVPPGDRSSPPRRPSPTRTVSSEYVEWPKPLSRSSPPTFSRPDYDRRNSSMQEGAIFKNLTWKATGLEPRLHTDVTKSNGPKVITNGSSPVTEKLPARQIGESSSAKVDFNGLKGVPTGPKQSPATMAPERSKIPNRSLPPVDKTRLPSPHIFISSDSLPAQISITRHLHRFLRRYIPGESDVCVDESGWYLFFEDTNSGRELLELCYKKAHQEKLFNQYTLYMDRYPDGQSIRIRNMSVTMNGTSDLADVIIEAHPSLADTATRVNSAPKDLDVPLLSDPLFGSKGAADYTTKSLSADFLMNGSTTSPPPADVILHHLRYSSPALRIPSRQDKDETSSSISGITGSDMSVTKRLKCHVCQTNSGFDSESLIHCSSCPRRYHRRCHMHPAIPRDLEQEHSWQCRRCIKKKVQPKSRLSNTSAAAAYSPAASVGQPEEPPRKKLRLDVSDRDASPNSEVISPGVNFVVNDGSDDDLNPRKRILDDKDQDSEDSYEPTERPPVNSDETRLFEANDLVAKSFASPDPHPLSAKSEVKTGRLSLLRKKLGLGEQARQPELTDRLESSHASARPATEVANEQSQSKRPTPPSDDEDVGLGRYRKSHKWAGGDADKSIIQTGTDYFQPRDYSPFPNDANTPLGVPKTRPTTDSVLMPAEIPQTPDDIAMSTTTVQTSAIPKFAEDPMLGSTVNRKTEPSISIQNGDVHPQPSATLKQRMKPSAPAVARCVKCEKKIAWQPSGTNKLCSRCKNEASTESTTGSSKSLSHDLAVKPKGHPDGTQPDNYTIAKEVVAEPLLPEDINIVLETGDQEETSDCPRASEFKPARPRRSCEKCRKQRRRCTHRNSDSAPEQDSAIAGIYQTKEGEPVEDDGSESDLNFWKAKPVPKARKPAANNDGLATHKIGEAAAEPDVDMDVDVDVDEDIDMDADMQSGRQRHSNQQSPGDVPASFQAKRQSQTRPAANAYDLGDSFSRPPNTYVKLIGMALCSASDHRLKGNDIVQWVIKNIPSYKAGEGRWESSLRATMTLKREGYNGGIGLWRIVDDGSKKNQGYMWELLPGVAEDMLHWDPVLGQPVSPPKGWRARQDEHAGGTGVGARRQRTPIEESSDSPIRSTKVRRRRRDDSTQKLGRVPSHHNRPQLDSPTKPLGLPVERHRSMNGTFDSSDEEPIAMKRKPKGRLSKRLNAFGTASVECDMNRVADVGLVTDLKSPSTDHESYSTGPGHRISRNRLSKQRIEGPTLLELIEIDAKKTSYSAKSLFDEWPEYDPKNEFDRVAKITEIKNRPTRKQRFKNQDSRVEMDIPDPVSPYVFSGSSWSPDRPRRTNRAAAYPWEIGEENVVHCDSIEELFNLPANPMAVITNGELTYKDASKNSRIVYKTGYA